MRTLPPFPDLRSFLGWCAGEGTFRRIASPVALAEEMTAVHRQVLLKGGPVLQFDQPVHANGRISPVPVVANLFGTRERVAAGLGVGLTDIPALGQFLAALRNPVPPDGVRDALSRWPQLAAALRNRPRLTSRAPVQDEVMKEPDLSLLPVQTCWPEDGGPLVTWPVVLTRPEGSALTDTAAYNAGVYRAQVLDSGRMILRWLAHRGGAAHHRNYMQADAGRGKPMPVAVVLGADPALLLGAALPLPETVSELAFSGVLRGARTRLVPARTIPMLVPADAEIIIEGWVQPGDTAPEGPFGDHTGYYNSVEPFPVLTVSAITHRRDPLYLSTWTGRPPDEPSVIGEVFNDLALTVIRQQIPEVRDLWLPPAACSYRMAVVSIAKRYPGQARRVMMALWGMLPQFSYTKMVVVVDEDIDPRNWDDIAWALATRYDPARDSMILDRTPMDYLDFASPLDGLAGKIGLDATVKTGSETQRPFGKVMKLSAAAEAAAQRILAAEGLS
ncbi:MULTISPECIES: UbiD family decarboxylase [unclassified Pannonibacter]|uniref:UbiD family decarboxylase n=1 Tax=unclassified Pannonibacter TaxID=2627228 RepID=UPI00164743AC|nr:MULTISPECIES: UbiD family decarboxylase [unclassified Pannonibacter]